MNRYPSSVPRVASGIAAVAMTAITIAVAVVIPAKVESGSHEPLTVAASRVTPPAVINVFIPPAVTDDVTHFESINVVGVRGLSAVTCAPSHRSPALIVDLPRARMPRRERV